MFTGAEGIKEVTADELACLGREVQQAVEQAKCIVLDRKKANLS